MPESVRSFILILVLAAGASTAFARDLPYSGRIRFHETAFSDSKRSVGEFEAETLGWMQHHRFLTFPIISSGSFAIGQNYRYSISDRSLMPDYVTQRGEEVDALSQGASFLFDRFHHRNWAGLFEYGADEESRLRNSEKLQEAFIVLEGKKVPDYEKAMDNQFLRQVVAEFGSLDEARKNVHLNDTRVRILNIKDRDEVVQSFLVWMPKPDEIEAASGFLGFRGQLNSPPPGASPGTPVPDGGQTIAMMVISLLVLAFGRRFFG